MFIELVYDRLRPIPIQGIGLIVYRKEEIILLFESLDKLKRNSIMTAILLMALGAVIIICPNEHLGMLLLAGGYTLVIFAIVMMLNFLSGKNP